MTQVSSPHLKQKGDGKRQKGVTISRPIVYGSIAFYLGRKSEETKTHRWHIYVRGAQGEDLSFMLSKVVITLHQSFTNPVRVLTEPPYEVSEIGWGEFESKIQLHFQDPHEPPIELFHLLKLYPSQSQVPTSKRPVVHEYYDELVFHEPTEAFYKKLMAGPEKEAPVNPLEEHLPVYSEWEDMQKIQAAQQWINQQTDEFKNRLLLAEIETKRARAQLKEFENKAQTTTAPTPNK